MKVLVEKIASYIRRVYLRFFKFGVVGFSGTIVDFGVFFILIYLLKESPSQFVLNYVVPGIAYEISVVNNFLFSYFWVWKDKKERFVIQFLKYNLSTTLSFVIRLALFNLALFIFKVTVESDFYLYYGLYVLAFVFVVLLNFLLIDNLVFKGKSDESGN